MKVQIEIDLSDEEIEMLRKAEDGIKANSENTYFLRKLFYKSLLHEDNNSWGTYYEPTRFGHMILEKIDEDKSRNH